MRDEAIDAVWVVYHRPPGYPEHYVVQMWLVDDWGACVPHPYGIVCATLEEVKEQIPAGCVFVPPDPGENPLIVGTWM